MSDGLRAIEVPDIEDPQFAPFWDGTKKRRLLIQACGSCELQRWPPRITCPACSSLETSWQERSARGTLFSWTTVGRPTVKGYNDVPYTVGIVSLVGSPSIRLVGNIVGIEPGKLKAGLPLVARFTEAGPAGEVTLVNWELET